MIIEVVEQFVTLIGHLQDHIKQLQISLHDADREIERLQLENNRLRQ